MELCMQENQSKDNVIVNECMLWDLNVGCYGPIRSNIEGVSGSAVRGVCKVRSDLRSGQEMTKNGSVVVERKRRPTHCHCGRHTVHIIINILIKHTPGEHYAP
eukprot:TRINITY_DN6063_c0_g1_i4.p1 TRINITY_DN6063_c0_g1~~TRINITY_DN6063_c0_g1_i4.p1  ORF type:complete len:119 (-),score=0.59 TRINITY_DN6063_c0_g1_i4:227-535(-)